MADPYGNNITAREAQLADASDPNFAALKLGQRLLQLRVDLDAINAGAAGESEVIAALATSAAAKAFGGAALSGFTTLTPAAPATIAALTDNSGGSANNTLGPVGATNTGDESGAINANFADLAAKVNEIRTALAALGLSS